MDKPRATIASLDDIGEDDTVRLRDCYVEASQEQADRCNDGKKFFIFTLKRSSGWANVDADRLNKNLENSRSAERKLARFGEITPDEAKAAVDRVDDLTSQLSDAKKGGKAAGDWEKQKGDLVTAHQTELAKRDAANANLSGELHENLALGELRTELEKAGFTKHRKLIESQFKDLVKYIPSDNGNPGRTGVFRDDRKTERLDTTTGQPMTVAQLAAEAAASDDFSILLDGDGASGAGLTGGGNDHVARPAAADGPVRVAIPGDPTMEEIDAIAERGQATEQ